MAKIKNMGTATMKFGEGIIVKGTAGTDSYALVVTGSAYVDDDIKLKGKLDVIASDVNNDVAIEITAANNDVVAMRFGNNANDFGYNLIYSGTATGNNNAFTIQTDGGSGGAADVEAFKMLQDGSTFIGENGILTVTGSRVGIGTATPEAGYKVHISGSLATYLLIGEGSGGQKSTAAAATIFHANRGNESVTGSVGVTSPIGGIGKFILGTESPHDVEVQTSGNTQLYLSASGGLGVSWPPNESLTVNGVISLKNHGVTPNIDTGFGKLYVPSSNSGSIFFRNDSGTTYDLTLGAANVAGNDKNLQYNNGGAMGGASALYYDDVNGRLGINRSIPDSRLHVAGDIEISSAGHLIFDTNGRLKKGSDTFLYVNVLTDGGSQYGTSLVNASATNNLLLSSSRDIVLDPSDVGAAQSRVLLNTKGVNKGHIEIDTEVKFHSLNHLTMSATQDIYLDADGGQIVMANGETNYFTFNVDSTPEIDVNGGLIIDATGDITLDAGGGDIYLSDNGAQRLRVEDTTGDVAIGTHAPSYRLDVRDSGSSYVGSFESTNTDDSSHILRLKLGKTGDLTTNNRFIDLLDGDDDVNGRIRGNGSGGITYSSAFTGQHPTSIASLTNVTTGMIVDSTGEVWSKYEENMETGIPKVSVTNSQNSKRVFGVIANLSGSFEGMVKASNQLAEETHIEINSLGEGLVWITNINGDIENGDYITSSDVFGLGQKQSDDILRSCTVAKCTEQIAWSSVSDSITHNGVSYKKYLSMCTYHCG